MTGEEQQNQERLQKPVVKQLRRASTIRHGCLDQAWNTNVQSPQQPHSRLTVVSATVANADENARDDSVIITKHETAASNGISALEIVRQRSGQSTETQLICRDACSTVEIQRNRSSPQC